MTITWRNVAGPDFSSASNMMSKAGNAFESALTGLQGMAQDQTRMNISNQNQEIKQNTQAAIEQIAGIKNIDDYKNMDMNTLVSKYGTNINREEVFNAFESRDEEIYADQETAYKRMIATDMRTTGNEVSKYVSEGLTAGKTQEEMKAGLDILLADKPLEVRSAARNQFLENMEYENTLTPEGKLAYEAGMKSLEVKYQVEMENINDSIASQEAIIGRDPLKDTTDLRSEMSMAEYVNQHAPDKFWGAFSLPDFIGGAYEGSDITELTRKVTNDKDTLRKVRDQMVAAGIPTREANRYGAIPDDVFKHAIMTAHRNSDGELKLGSTNEFQKRIVDLATQYYAYGKDASIAKSNMRSLNSSRISLADKQSRESLALRKRVKNFKTAKNNLLGK